jgi:dCTP deaminase
MCVLTRSEIQAELRAGRLVIDPLLDDQIGPASVDLHLGPQIRVPRGPIDPEAIVHVTETSDPAQDTQRLTIEDFYVLRPGCTVHGVTLERIVLPPNLCGWLEGRSRTARFGLTVHVTSGFVHPGVANHQVLEMTNVSQTSLALHPGIRICQIVLERTEGHAVYRGRFADQVAP